MDNVCVPPAAANSVLCACSIAAVLLRELGLGICMMRRHSEGEEGEGKEACHGVLAGVARAMESRTRLSELRPEELTCTLPV